MIPSNVNYASNAVFLGIMATLKCFLIEEIEIQNDVSIAYLMGAGIKSII